MMLRDRTAVVQPPHSGGRDPVARVAVLLDARTDERAMVSAACELCERSGASLELVHVAQSLGPLVPVMLELPIEWELAVELQRREHELLGAALGHVRPGVVLEPPRKVSCGLPWGGQVRRAVETADVVLVPCRCRPALRHRWWCRAVRLARMLDVPVVAVKALGR